MSSELQRYNGGGQVSPTQTGQLSQLDQWVMVVRDVSNLAQHIADTPFVPDGMRGNPAAVTAAILTGREMGLGPMTSLQHIHVIKGKPGKSAEIMRGMVLAAGHHIRDVEVTDTRVVLEGRRREEDRWTRVSFTADQAKRARIDLGGYPEDKLYARATTRLCRRKFADIVGGIALTIDELEDLPEGADASAAPAPAEDKPKRTAKRRTPSKKDSASNTEQAKPEPATSPQAAGDPPLPGDDDEGAAELLASELGAVEAEDRQATSDSDTGVTRPQLEKIHAQLNDLAVTERADKLTTVGLLVQRELASSSELTKREADQVIDTLSHVLDNDEPVKALDAILAGLELKAD